jgi:SAM-dependent methyltransferase
MKDASHRTGEPPSLTDQHYHQTEQYRDASTLNARAYLHRRYSTNGYPWQRWLWDQFDLPAACHVLDIGCGPGGLWSQNLERVPVGWEVVLADFSPGMVQKARQGLDPSRPMGYAVADVQFLPFADGCFEAVIANQMLYHVPDRAQALSEIARVLQPGGRLYAATLGHNYLRELRELLAQVGVDASGIDAATEFGLENGAEQLARHFGQVTLHRREDALNVTEAEPLIAYALSTSCAAALRPKLDAFRRLVEHEIATQGAIYMPKESGLFEALTV